MFFAALVTLLVFIIATIYYFEFRLLRRLDVAVAESSDRLAERGRSVRNYRERVAFYRTDEGIAHLAREHYNLAFPGERVYIIAIDPSENVPEADQR